ncbi:MAG: dephospho-CoA kinase [Bacteroidia bacterium]
MLKIGITGGIGSGKSIVCKIFSQLLIPVYVADEAAKKLMITDPELISNLEKEFGEKIYYSKNELNKKKLADIVFNNPEALKKVNSLVHPAVRKDFDKWAEEHYSAPYVIEEAAILFESGAYNNMDYVITVIAPEEVRLKRVMLRDNVSEGYVKDIAKNQMSEEEKKQLADFVVVNDTEQFLIPQVLDLHNRFLLAAENKK